LQFAMLRGRRLSVSVARARGSIAPPRSSAMRSSLPPASQAGPSSLREPVFRAPPAPDFSSVDSPPSSRSWDEASRGGPSRDKDKDAKDKDKKAAKKRKVKGATAERGPQRRKNEGFRAPRARGMMDDWDDD
jgi:hypothetical protein